MSPAAVPPELIFLDDLPCADGTIQKRIPIGEDAGGETVEVEIERSQDGRHRCTIALPLFERDRTTGETVERAWVSDVVYRTVFHTRLPNGVRYDWRVARKRRTRGGRLEITCDPPDVDLVDAGNIYTQTAGGAPDFSISWENETIEEVLTRVAIPYLHDIRGKTWITLGTITPSVLLSGEAERVTVGELIDILIGQAAPDERFEYERDGTSGYKIHVREPSVAQARLREGVNLVDITDTEDREEFATVYTPLGAEVGGVRMTAGNATWSVASTAAGEVALEDPAGGPGPVIEAGQFAANGLSGDKELTAHYLRRVDGTLEEITGSSVPGTFEVADESGFSVGDLVTIHPDSDGSLLHEIASPDGHEAVGRIARFLTLDEVGGRAQFSQNPKLADWTDEPVSGGCYVTAQVSSSVNVPVAGLEPGKTWPSGSRVIQTRSSQGKEVHHEYDPLDGNVTADANGEATLVLASPVNFGGTGAETLLLFSPTDGAPDDWSAPTPLMFGRRGTTAGELADLSGTTASAGGTTSDPGGALLGGLTADVDEIRMGDIVTIDGKDHIALHDVVADSSGEAWVAFDVRNTSWSSGAAFTVSRPDFAAGTYSDFVATLLAHATGERPVLQGPDSYVIHAPNNSTLWATVWAVLRAGENALTLREGTDLEPPAVALWDGTSEVAENLLTGDGDDGAIELAAGEETRFVFRTSFEISASGTYAVRPKGPLIAAPASGNVTVRAEPVMHVLGVELSLWPEEPGDTDPVVGNRSNLIHQRANLELSERAGLPPQIDATAREMVEDWGADPEEVALLREGQSVRITVPTLDRDVVYVLRRIRWTSERPTDPSFTLGRLRPDLTARLSGSGSGTSTTTTTGGGTSGGGTIDAYSKSAIDSMFTGYYTKVETRAKIGEAIHDVREYGDSLCGTGKVAWSSSAASGSSTITLGSLIHDTFSAAQVGHTLVVYGVENDDIIRREGEITAVNSATEAVVDFTFTSAMTNGDVFWFHPDQDDFDALQDAYNNAPAAYHPRGVYVIASGGLQYSRQLGRMFGDGSRQSIILQKTDTGLGSTIDFVDVEPHFTMEDLHWYGPGINGSLGGRVKFTRSTNSNINSLTIRHVEISGVAQNEALLVDTPILSRFENIRGRHVVGYPVRILNGVAYDIINVYGITCLTAGVFVDGGAGIGVQGSAAEVAGVGVLLKNAFSVRVSHTDCESLQSRIADQPSQVAASAVAGGSIPAGDYRVSFSWVRRYNAFSFELESLASPVSDPVTIDPTNATLEFTIPAPPNSLTTRANVYITPVDGAAGTEGLVEQVTLNAGATTTYQRTTSFTPGDSPREYTWRGHAIVVDGCDDVVVDVPTLRAVPNTDSRFIYVTGSTDVRLKGIRRLISSGATPDYSVEITDSCESIDYDMPNIPDSEVLDNQIRQVTAGAHRSVLTDDLRREFAARQLVGV